MLIPHSEVRSVGALEGLGVFATKRIPKGTITFVQDELDIVISPARRRAMPDILARHVDKHAYVNAHAEQIVSWDAGKFVNHSCVPGCLSTGFGFEIAIRDIEVGDEITDDYGQLNLSFVIDACRCGMASCRGTISADQFASLAPHWDEAGKLALAAAKDVAQPLWSLLTTGEQKTIQRFWATGNGYKGCAHLALAIDIPSLRLPLDPHVAS